MSQNLIKDELLWRISDWFQWLSPRELVLLKAYHDDLAKWTKKINLISQGTWSESDRIHFADSILGYQLIHKEIQSQSLMDLGSGNGFPAIVFAILNPSTEVECIDSDERKIAFIQQFAMRQEVKNLRVRCCRIESLGDLSIEYASARALASINGILDLCLAKVVAGGSIFMFKGAEWKNEVAQVSKLNCSTWNISLLGEYTLPSYGTGLQEKRAIIRASKI